MLSNGIGNLQNISIIHSFISRPWTILCLAVFDSIGAPRLVEVVLCDSTGFSGDR